MYMKKVKKTVLTMTMTAAIICTPENLAAQTANGEKQTGDNGTTKSEIPTNSNEATSYTPADSTVQLKDQKLGEVRITGSRRRTTEAAMVEETKKSEVVQSNVSAQEIQKTQDTNAGEVIKRIPGVSLIDEKFVMVRGLSQRYNNVWMNGGAVPSSEADARAFSFDIIPSSQIDNLIIVKSPAPEYPADYSGGFIIVNTKDIPSQEQYAISIGGNWNTQTAFRNFIASKAKHERIGTKTIDINSGIDNNWMTKNFKPWGDLKLNANAAKKWRINDATVGLIAAVNFTNEYRTYTDMSNNLFGLYDINNDKSNYLRQTTDDQYNHNTRFGAMLNTSLLSPEGNNKYEFKNILNWLTTNRYTLRTGTDAQSNQMNSAEYYYRSRLTYNGQITGKHTMAYNTLDWAASYSYANRYLPDRRRYVINDALETGTLALSNGNDINREFTDLNEHIMSAKINDNRDIKINDITLLKLKYGIYGEYRTRKYETRNFIYSWNPADNILPDGFRHTDIPSLLSNSQYLGDNGLYLIEEQNMRNNYKGRNTLGAAYATASLPLGKFSVYAGARYEYNRMKLISNTRDDQVSEKNMYYTTSDIFPSINTTYRFNDKHQIRLAYGRSINRPEFREVSPSVYYDFDLASNVQGNSELQACHIDNLDLRYEFYPGRGETVSIAAFYKHFKSPIEWTYTVSGGTDLIYSYTNAQSANSLGIEIDIRKDLGFIGLKNFAWSFNGALIHSRVNFPDGSKEQNRPMQGQSPYLINTGLFYKNPKLRLNISLLYNRIGKRIIGVGRSEGTTGNSDNARVPDSYEMPRDVMDITISKAFGEHWEIKANIKDIFAQSITYKQFANVTINGTSKEVQQITKKYKPGSNIGLTIQYRF